MQSPPGKALMFYLPLALAVVAGGVAWGGQQQKIEKLESQQAIAADDHDRIVRIETQITTITTQMGEGKTERKALADSVDALESEVQKGFSDLLLELQRQRNSDG